MFNLTHCRSLLQFDSNFACKRIDRNYMDDGGAGGGNAAENERENGRAS